MNYKIPALIILNVLLFVQCQDMSSSTTEKEGLTVEPKMSSSTGAPASPEMQESSKDEGPEDDSKEPSEEMQEDPKGPSEDTKDQEQADEAPPAQSDHVLANIPVTSSTVAPTRPANVASSTTPPPLVHNPPADDNKAVNPSPKDKNAAGRLQESMIFVAVAALMANLVGGF